MYNDTLSESIISIDTIKTSDKQAVRSFGKTSVSFANGFRKYYPYDSISPKAYVIVNAVRFPKREVLQLLPSYQILMIRPEFSKKLYVDSDHKIQIQTVQRQPSALVLQKHTDLPQDFFMFQPYTLVPTRYRCSAKNPIYDLLSFPEDTLLVNPRFLIDGILQARGFSFEQLKTQDLKHIEVFSPDEARRFFSQKFRKGVVVATTQNAKKRYDSYSKNIWVTEETQQKDGTWLMKSDTVLADIEAFRAYQKVKLTVQDAPIYLIDGELETEFVNRKSIDIDRIARFELKYQTRQFDAKEHPPLIDTVMITTLQERVEGNRLNKWSNIIYDLQKLRQVPTEEPTPLYIVDDKEISLEKLKTMAMSHLEMVAVLEGCDAIQKYGKRGEHGVVIYRSKL